MALRRPGTDAALILAVVHTLFAENLVTLGDLAAEVDGLATVRSVAADWPPERVTDTPNGRSSTSC